MSTYCWNDNINKGLVPYPVKSCEVPRATLDLVPGYRNPATQLQFPEAHEFLLPTCYNTHGILLMIFCSNPSKVLFLATKIA